jgi:hypothetical protein
MVVVWQTQEQHQQKVDVEEYARVVSCQKTEVVD